MRRKNKIHDVWTVRACKNIDNMKSVFEINVKSFSFSQPIHLKSILYVFLKQLNPFEEWGNII